MMSDPAIPDSLEDLLVECLERLDSVGEDGVRSVLDAHPEHAAALRRHLSRLNVLGLTESRTHELESIPDRLGDFRLIRRLGGGGMGVVYLAEQVSLDRHVALKLIRPEQMFFPSARARFEREIELIARLQHPGIVPVYSVGQSDGLPYFAMECVDGCTLAEVLGEVATQPIDGLQGRDLAQAVDTVTSRRRELLEHSGTESEEPLAVDLFDGSWASCCAKIVQRVALAAEHAHQRGVLHRDLKPSNLMITPGGRVLILDFGLAHGEGDARLTRSGAPVGSLVYMAPEQVRGEELDARADVYSLGVTLYELLCREVPYRATSQTELRREILGGEPAPLRKQSRSIPADLETICTTALDVDPARRFASMSEFARDLGRFLAKEPIHARPPSLVRRIGRWIQRHPASTLGLVLAFVALVVVPFIAIRSAINTSRERAAAEYQSYLANIGAASAALRLHDIGEARLRLERAPQTYRNWEWHWLSKSLDASRAVFRLPDVMPAPGNEPGAAVTADGRWIVCVGYRSVQVYDAKTRELRESIVFKKADGWLSLLTFDVSRARNLIALALRPKTLQVRRLPGLELVHSFSCDYKVNATSFARDGQRLASVGATDRGDIWNLRTGRVESRFDVAGGASSVVFSIDGTHVIAGGITPKHEIVVWDRAAQKTTRVLRGHESTVSALAAHPDGRRLVSGSMDHTVALWELATGQLIHRRSNHLNGIIDLDISADGALVATGSMDRTIRIQDASSLRERDTLTGHTEQVRSLRFSSTGELISASRDGTARLWDPRGNTARVVLRGTDGDAYANLAFGPGEGLLTCVADHRLQLWDLTRARLLRQRETIVQLGREVLHDAGKILVGGHCGVFDAKTFESCWTVPTRPRGAGIGMASYESTVFVGHSLGHLCRWDYEKGELIEELEVRADKMFSRLAVSDDQRVLVAWDTGGALRTFALPDCRPRSRFVPPADRVTRIAIQPGSYRVALAGSRLMIVNPDTRESVECSGHTAVVLDVAFSPDGTRMASASTDGTARVWDTATGQQILVLPSVTPYCTAVTWSPDGKTLAVGGGNYDTRVVLYRVRD